MIDMDCEIKVVESLAKYNKELNERLKNGIDKPERGVVMTPETFSKVFSAERIKLLQRVCQNNIKNIYQLAKEMDKPYEVVFRNIKYLEGIGLIKITEKDRKKIPHLACKLRIDMVPHEVMAA
jgi:predicted transcriptional regulator